MDTLDERGMVGKKSMEIGAKKGSLFLLYCPSQDYIEYRGLCDKAWVFRKV